MRPHESQHGPIGDKENVSRKDVVIDMERFIMKRYVEKDLREDDDRNEEALQWINDYAASFRDFINDNPDLIARWEKEREAVALEIEEKLYKKKH